MFSNIGKTGAQSNYWFDYPCDLSLLESTVHRLPGPAGASPAISPCARKSYHTVRGDGTSKKVISG